MGPLLTSRLLVASIILAFLSLGGLLLPELTAEGSFSISPDTLTTMSGETITVTLSVAANVPVNVFAGEIHFDPKHLVVDKIDYSVSVADLWAKEPWYENGDGTLSFAGGTTKPGGFVGEETLLTVTFSVLSSGVSELTLQNETMLRHDGQGSTATLTSSLDTLIDSSPITASLASTPEPLKVVAGSVSKSFDISGDGKQSITDASILLTDIISGNERSDLNEDGKVSLVDLSILLDTF